MSKAIASCTCATCGKTFEVTAYKHSSSEARSFWSFAANHLEYDPVIPGKVRRTLNTDYLVEKIAPYTYQVSRDECFRLPDRHYYERGVQMTAAQERHYDEITSAMIEQLDEQVPSTIYRMFAAAQAVISGLCVEDDGRHFRTRPMFKTPAENPRIRELISITDTLDDGEQAIIFCKYVHEIEAILQLLPGAVPFYGRQSQRARQSSLEAFRAGARFLVANKTCAGYGLNLQFCHNVIYYSNDWDWATRVQSEDRVYRLGQDRQVTVWDIFAYDSLDVKILRCLARKEGLSDAVKRELRWANAERDPRGKFRQWLRGEMEETDGEALSGQERL